MKKILISIAIILFNYILFSQDNKKTFFLNGDKNNISESYTIFNSEMNCNCMKEIGLLSKIDTSILCLIGNEWIIKNNGTWKIFWNYKSINITSKEIFWFNSLKTKLVWGEIIRIFDKEIYTFYLVPTEIIKSTKITFYFDPKEGIIGYNLDGDKYFLQGIL